MSHRTSACYCPDCGHGPLDAATGIDDDREDHRPVLGDVSLCIGCGAFLEFDEELRLVVLTAAKMRRLPSPVRDMLHRARRVIHEVAAERAAGTLR